MILPLLKSQVAFGPVRLLADIAVAVLEHRALAFRAGAERSLRREVDRLAGFGRLGLLAEVELELPVLHLVVEGQLQLGGERPARLGAEAFERADLLVGQQPLDLGQLEAAAARDLADREAAAFARCRAAPLQVKRR